MPQKLIQKNRIAPTLPEAKHKETCIHGKRPIKETYIYETDQYIKRDLQCLSTRPMKKYLPLSIYRRRRSESTKLRLPKFQHIFTGVHVTLKGFSTGIPKRFMYTGQKSGRENRLISRSKYFKSDLLRERITCPKKYAKFFKKEMGGCVLST